MFEMKLTPNMLTTMGFTSTKLGKQDIPQRMAAKPYAAKYYVGISGGGWRALSGHMGAFRVLGNTGALSMVDMLSSVSGGTWFAIKFAFDDDFAQKVLSNEMTIAEAVLEWFEKEYFPVLRNVEHTRQSQQGEPPGAVVRSSLSTIVSQAPAVIKSALGT